MADGSSTSSRGPAGESAALDGVLLEHIDDALVVIDPAGTIVEATGGAARLVGGEVADLVGQPVEQLVHVSDVARISSPTRSAPIYVRQRSGTSLLCRATASPAGGTGGVIVRLEAATGEWTGPVTDEQAERIDAYCDALGARFMAAVTSDRVLHEFEATVAEVAALTDADGVSVFLENHSATALQRVVRWVQPSLAARTGRESIAIDLDPAAIEIVLTTRFRSDNLEVVPELEGSDLVNDLKLRSVLTAPLNAGGQRGIVAFMRFSVGRTWTDNDAALVDRVADMFGRALSVARSEQLLALTYDEGPIGFSVRSWDGTFIDCNPRYLDVLERSEEEVRTHGLDDMLHPEDRDRFHQRLGLLRAGEVDRLEHDARIVLDDGSNRWVRVNCVHMRPPGSQEDLVLTSIEDVTDSHEQREALEYAVRHDNLTGLANRAAMHEAIERLEVETGRLPHLLLIDLDRFKSVNDTLGHLAGDKLLQIVAKRLIAQTRHDTVVVRLGGDEFAIVTDPIDAAEVIRLANRIRTAVNEPILLDGHTVTQSISIGIGLGTHCVDVSELLNHADQAMYAAKEAGRDCSVVYDASFEVG